MCIIEPDFYFIGAGCRRAYQAAGIRETEEVKQERYTAAGHSD
jgi:hypothetical protein